MAFVHLHNHTQYTVLDGACSPKELMERASKLEMSSVAITDSCNLYCAVEMYKNGKALGVKPVYGSEIWVWPEGIDTITDKTPDGGWHLAFLVENKQGYHNLCRLITEAIYHGMHYRPRIDFSQIERYNEGLIALTSGLNGPLGHALRSFKTEEDIRHNLQRLGDIFGEDRLFLEMQDFAIPQQQELNSLARRMGKEFNLRTVVTNDVRYIEPYDAVTLDMLNCISKGEKMDNLDRFGIETDQQYFKSEEEMRALFPNDPEALDVTVEIADRCNFKFVTDTYWFPATTPPDADKKRPDGIRMDDKEYWADTQANWEYFYEAFPPPRSFQMPDPATEKIPAKPDGAGNLCGYFEWYCREGLKVRLRRIEESEHPKYWARLDREMQIIEYMGFPAYMLIVAEFINWSKDHHIPVGPGRGSAAGSIVAWAMAITNIDPMPFGLLFERFLNPERVSMPDIDVDFCQDRREEAIEHVRVKYGRELVSQIITYGKLAARAAIKDVARVLGVEFRSSNEIANFVPEKPGTKLNDALQDQKLLSFMDTDPLVRRVIQMALRVEGMTRQTGIHAAGVVIADRPLVEHGPLYRDGPEGGPVIQYDMKSSEDIGLIKFDFLGLKTLDQIRDALEMIERNTGEDIDIDAIPIKQEDPSADAAYTLLSRGDSVGVFQLESDGMQQLLIKMKPRDIEDVIASIALYRPGPLSSGMDQTFVACKNEGQTIEYLHPMLEPILQNTYGSIVYQEQVMQIAQDLSGYSLGEADLLRRAMGKKKISEMEKQKVRFIKGALERGIEEQTADEIFELMAFFAGYGFNKSHSAAYGMISYQTAWLKAHHRAEYMAALMSVECGNTEKVLNFISDCKRNKFDRIEILFPDINKSQLYFDVPKDNRKQIRYGLGAIKGAGEKAIRSILTARDNVDGTFNSFMHCLEQLDYQTVNKRLLENLIKCGAFDWTDHTRRSLLSILPKAVDLAQETQDNKRKGQFSLFGGAVKAPELTIPDEGEWPLGEKMEHEFAALGMYITNHPLKAYQDVMDQHGLGTSQRFVDTAPKETCRIAGLVCNLRFSMSPAKGTRTASFDLEDHEGKTVCFVFRDVVEHERLLQSGEPLCIKGRKDCTKAGKQYINVSEVVSLIELREKNLHPVQLLLESADITKENVQRLNELIENSPGKCRLEILLNYPTADDEALVSLSSTKTITLTNDFVLGIENLLRRPDAVRLA